MRAASSSHINAASLTRLTVLIFVFHNQSVMSSIIIVVHLRRKPNGFPLRLALKLTVNTRSKLPAWKFHQSVGVCNSFHRGNRVILPWWHPSSGRTKSLSVSASSCNKPWSHTRSGSPLWSSGATFKESETTVSLMNSAWISSRFEQINILFSSSNANCNSSQFFKGYLLLDIWDFSSYA